MTTTLDRRPPLTERRGAVNTPRHRYGMRAEYLRRPRLFLAAETAFES